MPTVNSAISISLDGYVAGPNADTIPLGDGGHALHEWFMSAPASEHPVLKPAFERLGAMICGRLGFDEAFEAWGPDPAFACPIFVLTHRPQEPIVRGRTTYRFVEGFDAALAQARAVCPEEKMIALHGASPVQQALRAQVLDSIMLHVVPITLGGGTSLFEPGMQQRFERLSVREDVGVTHVELQPIYASVGEALG